MDKKRLIILICALITTSMAAKVLLIPADHKGHVNYFTVAGKELQKRGHEVVILAQGRNRHIVEKSGLTFILNEGKSSQTTPLEDYKRVSGAFFSSGFSSFRNTVNLGYDLAASAKESCYEIVQNKDIMSSLVNHKFDVALGDGFDAFRCLYIIPYKLGLKYITLAVRQDPWVAGLPAMPSVEGMFGMLIMKPDTSYAQLFANLGLYVATYLAFPPSIFKDEQIAELVPEKPVTTYEKLFKSSEVFLVNFDNTCMDYPRIEAPHYRFIGGVAASPAKPLPNELEQFVSKASDGLIVVSFGSLVKRAPKELLDKFMKVFSTIPQRVIMRYDGPADNVPANVMLTKWLPQNDLLGHAKTKLFIAHGGNNGQMEALYHGVPMIIMPFAGDQMYSAKKLEDKTYGKVVNPMDFTQSELKEALDEVLNNPVYRHNIKTCSEISKSFPNAHESIHFWVEHVVKFDGAKHMHPISVNMPMWRVFMFDVLAIIAIIGILISYSTFKCCKCTYKRCMTSKSSKKKSD